MELLDVLAEVVKLKRVMRGTKILDRHESTSEHSYHCMLIADMLVDAIDEPLDKLKVLRLCMYHDLVEVYAGDYPYLDEEKAKEKHEKEQQAFEKLRQFLPTPDYPELFEDYEGRISREAQLAKAIDCLEAIISDVADPGIIKDQGYTEEVIRNQYTEWVSKFELTNQLFEQILDRLREQRKI